MELTKLVFTWYNTAGVRSLHATITLARSTQINLGDSLSLAMERLSTKEEADVMGSFMHNTAVVLEGRGLACTEEGVAFRFLQEALYFMDYTSKLHAIRSRKGKLWEEVRSRSAWQKGDRAATMLYRYTTARLQGEICLQ